jgi:hypothetical protein
MVFRNLNCKRVQCDEIWNCKSHLELGGNCWIVTLIFGWRGFSFGALGVMETSAKIRLESDAAEICFEWLGFDGDDCFGDFHITVIESGKTHRFDFGPCVVWGVRKPMRFFADTSQTTVGGGFRHPDIRHYDLHRSGDSFRLVIRFEGSDLHEEFHIRRPSVYLADELLKAYDG